MFNSVNGNVQNGVIVQNNKMQKNNIAYRGKATNALEATPTRDEFQKKGLGKGAKFALGTLGLAGIAVVVDRLFLKGKYTDDILKWLKNNGDDVTQFALSHQVQRKKQGRDNGCDNCDMQPAERQYVGKARA